MIFASNVFLFLYLPTFFIVYYSVKASWRSTVIVIASYLFYAWWRPDFLLLFIGITAWNFWLGLLIKKQLDKNNKKAAFRILWVGVIGDLATLGYFKYVNFGVEIINAVLEPLGFNTFTLTNILLPLGISFYVFHALSYIVDIYRKNAVPTKSFIDFAAFVSLFPHLVAGPILRYSELAPQFKHREHSLDIFSLGVCRFFQGFIMKVLIADNLAGINALFLGQNTLHFFEAWFGLVASCLQLYFDFAGYSCMAIGLALMMGFKFPENFNQPYASQSITEFWQRWHITLAHYLRDYLFMPLVRNKIMNPLLAIIFTLTVSGLWHGASAAMVLWGFYLGTCMALERVFGVATKLNTPWKFLRYIRAVFLVLLAMPLFFTSNLNHSIDIYGSLFGLNGFGDLDIYIYGSSRMTVAFLAITVLWTLIAGIINKRYYLGNKDNYFMQRATGFNSLLLWAGFLLALSSLAANSFSPFLYFQF
ncbi:membrane-bound O-acyltransferase family protein [Entomomonas sp. E2T0]|uniref:MBOAT family O-acyltransferase n=1 Tax=Entomomonas sp. E2T0 TaxID=2930213 RepID=UPI0022283B39|nr:MBOAT family O-acyltransferase [Entomomonas sp. E2T0]UYZ83294.1 membrane-bound O-acyltransferase family protein [Entomomonas sp. E2T0]